MAAKMTKANGARATGRKGMFMVFVGMVIVVICMVGNDTYSRQGTVSLAAPAPVDHTRYRIYVETKGRLGNIMFQYAALFGVASYTHRDAVIITETHIESIFPNCTEPLRGGKFEIRRPSKGTSQMLARLAVVNEAAFGRFSPQLLTDLPDHDVHLCCYFESYKYFANETSLRHRFTFSSGIQMKAKKVFDTLTEGLDVNHTIVVGVHVRRGDLASASYSKKGYRLPTNAYFTKAYDYFKNKYGSVHFIIASNDIKWCESHITLSNKTQSVGQSAEVDMALLGLCDHVIITVGTFSWMIGYLSRGEVVYYKDYIKKNTEVDKKYSREDQYPPHWIPMGD